MTNTRHRVAHSLIRDRSGEGFQCYFHWPMHAGIKNGFINPIGRAFAAQGVCRYQHTIACHQGKQAIVIILCDS